MVFCTEMVAAAGLKFKNPYDEIDKRTSYTVFENRVPKFNGSFDIEFDLRLYPVHEIGYILRVKNDRSDKIFNLFYDGRDDNFFKLNEEGKNNLIFARIDRQRQMHGQWLRVKLTFDLKGDQIVLSIDGEPFVARKVELPDDCRPTIVFGRSDHIIEVPTFAIRNLRVGNEKSYFFKLDQPEGEEVYESQGRIYGRVTHPEWLINNFYHWQFLGKFSSQGVAAAGYNPLSHEVYYFNRDSLQTFNVRTEQHRVQLFDQPCPVPMVSGFNFIDTCARQIYAYEVYDERRPDAVSMASLDLNTLTWKERSRKRMSQPLFHHGAVFQPQLRKLALFGGFGYMKYSSDFHVFDVESDSWKANPAESLGGDRLYPRYFLSMGASADGKWLYHFGGMGNESGDQSVGRYYYYDLHRVNLKTRQVEKLWSIPWQEPCNMVPVKSMIVRGDSCFYMLCYPECVSASKLQLYKFSIPTGKYELVSDTLAIRSDKINTNADLYYDEALQSLYAVVQEFEDDIRSTISVYQLSFPPVTESVFRDYSRPVYCGGGWLYGGIVLVVAVVLCGGVLLVKWRRRRRMEPAAVDTQTFGAEKPETESRPNSICYFGDFMVRDRNNRDITYLFTGRQKQLFTLILQSSVGGGGITSQKLSNIMWPDKPKDKVKNSRGVTINHLRKTLEEIDGLELIFEKGFFKMVMGGDFFCDYVRVATLLSDEEQLPEHRDELLQLVSRGKFLAHEDDPVFDGIKEEVEGQMMPMLCAELQRAFEEEDYALSVSVADAVFCIDPINDLALSCVIKALNRLKQTDEALLRYQSFVFEYKKIFDKDYPHSFKDF